MGVRTSTRMSMTGRGSATTQAKAPAQTLPIDEILDAGTDDVLDDYLNHTVIFDELLSDEVQEKHLNFIYTDKDENGERYTVGEGLLAEHCPPREFEAIGETLRDRYIASLMARGADFDEAHEAVQDIDWPGIVEAESEEGNLLRAIKEGGRENYYDTWDEFNARAKDVPTFKPTPRGLDHYLKRTNSDFRGLRRPEFNEFVAGVMEAYGAETIIEDWSNPEFFASVDDVNTDAHWYQGIEFPEGALTDEVYDRIRAAARELNIDIEGNDDTLLYLEDNPVRDECGGWDGWNRAEFAKSVVGEFIHDVDPDVALIDEFEAWMRKAHPGAEVPSDARWLFENYGITVRDNQAQLDEWPEED